MQSANSGFSAAWWCRNRHLQTLWPYLFRRARLPALQHIDLETPDNDTFRLSISAVNTGPTVLILHGLEGRLQSHYARAMVTACHQRGWRAAFMHFRGCDGRPNRKWRSYHAGEMNDPALAIRFLKERFPTSPLMVVGYSIGGSALLNLLARHPVAVEVLAAAAVSVPYDLADAANVLDRGFSKLYQWRLLASLKRKIIQKQKFLPVHEPPLECRHWNSFWRFDNQITAPLHGFGNVDNYYAQSSAKQYLSQIATPTLLIHASDDPFMSHRSIPRQEELPDAIELELTEHGGHVGYVCGNLPLWPDYWLETRLCQYFAQKLIDIEGPTTAGPSR